MAADWKTSPAFQELKRVCPEFASCLERDSLLDANYPRKKGVSMRQHFLDALDKARTRPGAKPLIDIAKDLLANPRYGSKGPKCAWVTKQRALGRVVGKWPFDQQLTSALMSATGSVHSKVIEKQAAEASDALIKKRDLEKVKEIAHILEKARLRSTRAPVTTMGSNPSWSFRMPVDLVQKLSTAQQELLPCQLALPYHKREVAAGKSGPWIAYSHTKKPKVGYRVPTTLDASILPDTSVVFDPGGKTKPFGHCAKHSGLEEVIHNANSFYDIVGVPNSPDAAGFMSRIR